MGGQRAFARQRIACVVAVDPVHAVEEGVTQGEVLARGEVHGQRIEGLFVLPPAAVADPALVVDIDGLPTGEVVPIPKPAVDEAAAKAAWDVVRKELGDGRES